MFFIELLYIFNSTLTEVESWNRKNFTKDETIESVLNCKGAAKNAKCCNETIFSHSKFASAFEALRSHRRPSQELSSVMVPLVVGLSVVIVTLVIQFPYVQLRLAKLATSSKTVLVLFRILDMVGSIFI